MPLPPACCRDATGVQGVGNVSQGRCAGLLSRSNDRENVRCVSVGRSLHSLYRASTGYVELGISERNTARLGRSESLTCSRCDECTFLLSEGRKEVKDEWINVRPEFRD